ncbi:DEKNAAC102189 [Brettanomyces naardenensis]|uniref:Sorting nexin MVP1 n=1 Tax=Brettanomyces naardenensis TaxID=13370 RepID=A0A448YJT3_BRENA|nr:DEKNAAC102189 [Brettanomyces naardenensis]
MYGSSSSLGGNNWNSYNSNDILTGTTDPLAGDALARDHLSTADTLADPLRTADPLGATTFAPEQGKDNAIDSPVDDPDDPEDESHQEEEDSYRALQSSEWADDVVAKFNPLSYRNSDDKTLVNVKEIPEKEGLVFKHINYLVAHNLKFPSEYYLAADNNNGKQQTTSKNRGETKVIRRYSDFAWLVEVLWKKYPFRLIPELPPKKFALASANDPIFLQKRRRGLQRFLYQLVKHPVLSKENLVVMFLTVPNDFSNWKKFANVELSDEFEGIRVQIPKRFRINMDHVLRGLRDNESEETVRNASPPIRNDTVINDITQIWSESPVDHKSLEFVENFDTLNNNLTRLADLWSKFTLLADRIERRELAVAADHQRASAFLEHFMKVDTEVFGLDNIVENKTRRMDEEAQNLNIINTILGQALKFFQNSKQLKDEEMGNVSNEVMENFKKFQDYMTSLHFLMQRVTNYKNESERQIHLLLNKVTRTNERLSQIKGKSDIKGSEVDRLVTIATQTFDQLNTLISRVILVKSTFINEYALYQKTKYIISEVFQDWFRERMKYGDLQLESLQRLVNDLQDLPLR